MRNTMIAACLALLCAIVASAADFIQTTVAGSASVPGTLTVDVDRSVLGRPTLTVALDDVRYVASLIDSSELTSDEAVYRYESGPGLVSTFTVHGGKVAATIYGPAGSYTLLPRPSGYELTRPGWCSGAPCELSCGTASSTSSSGERFANAAASATARRRAVRPPPPAPVEIDIAKIYTGAAQAAVGGTERIELAIRHSVDVMNTVLQATGVGHVRFRLVYVGPAEYQDDRPGKDLIDALRWLAGISSFEAPAPQFERMQDLYGADIVELWIGNQDARASGVAKNVFHERDFKPENGACAVVAQAAVNSMITQHEEGHLLRLEHDLANAYPYLEFNPIKYAHGFIHPTEPAFRDVMSYPFNCPGCLELAWFSNPQNKYLGVAAGDPETSDAARVLRWSAPIVSKYSAIKTP